MLRRWVRVGGWVGDFGVLLWVLARREVEGLLGLVLVVLWEGLRLRPVVLEARMMVPAVNHSRWLP